MENLIVVPTSQASCDQRAGRAGRTKRIFNFISNQKKLEDAIDCAQYQIIKNYHYKQNLKFNV